MTSGPEEATQNLTMRRRSRERTEEKSNKEWKIIHIFHSHVTFHRTAVIYSFRIRDPNVIFLFLSKTKSVWSSKLRPACFGNISILKMEARIFFLFSWVIFWYLKMKATISFAITLNLCHTAWCNSLTIMPYKDSPIHFIPTSLTLSELGFAAD
jgi:hypothetical protein